MYFVTTRTGDKNTLGNLPLTAAEALAFLEKANGSRWAVEIRDGSDNLISLGQLREEVGQKAR
jgi:hypothetical protein